MKEDKMSESTFVHQINPPKREVCSCEIFPEIVLNLPEWPSRWKRFWLWVFFGLRFKPF